MNLIKAPKLKTEEENEIEYNKKISYSGLPFEVKFCKKCIISNQRPVSALEYLHTYKTQKKTIKFHKDGICDACKVQENKKNNINWEKREKELLDLCNKYRGNGKYYDCLVPGSGGKDARLKSTERLHVQVRISHWGSLGSPIHRFKMPDESHRLE